METVETGKIVERKPSTETANVLLVDDEMRNLDVLETILQPIPGLRLVRAGRAEDALLALLRDDFACIVLDIQMPGMNGLELARQIKARKRNQYIPIIFLTAFFLDEKDVISGYGAGAVDYLTKPINPEILKSKVGAFAELFRTARALSAANNALELEISQRERAEDALRQANNELERRVRERTAELAESEERYKQLYGLAAAVNAASSLEAICNAALGAVMRCQKADRTAILLCDSEGVMRFRAWQGLSDDYRRAVESHSPWQKGELPQPVLIADVSEAELAAELRETIEKEGIRSLAFIPITYEKRLLGKFMIYFNARHSFAPEELRPTQTIASQVAFAIEREHVSEQIKRAHNELLAASRAKDDFLATLSHELRTPLNPVLLLASEAANNRDLPPRVRAEFNTIRKNVEMEARLIDDLLDLTRIARGKITLDKHFINLRAVLQEAIAQVREDMDLKQIILDLRLKAAHHTVFADAVRLQQIFWNLLKNAVKFTPEGGNIMVETSLNDGKLLVQISDTGIGMTPDELAGVFKAFSQGSHAARNNHLFGGLGLGLSISQRLAEFHSGKIVAASDGRNKGSTFTLELPLASAAEVNGNAGASRPCEESPTNVGRGIRILLVEDHEPTRTTLTSLLLRRRYDVAAAATAAEARALAVARDFDLLITDIGLPDGNGYDLMSELRTKKDLRGIALTGYGMEHDVARSESVGFDAHLTKPVRIQSLEAALEAMAKRKAGQGIGGDL